MTISRVKHSIPSRTRQWNPYEPMVLCLKARESRSLPDFQSTLLILYSTYLQLNVFLPFSGRFFYPLIPHSIPIHHFGGEVSIDKRQNAYQSNLQIFVWYLFARGLSFTISPHLIPTLKAFILTLPLYPFKNTFILRFFIAFIPVVYLFVLPL